jgi:hypothetical protein
MKKSKEEIELLAEYLDILSPELKKVLFDIKDGDHADIKQ